MNDERYPVRANILNINWAPSNVVEEVLQNVATILSTQIGTVPYSRTLGVSTSLVDNPMPAFIAAATREVIQKVSEFEPRAIIHTVSYEDSDTGDGAIRPKLTIGVKQ